MADRDADFERINNAITALSRANYGNPIVDKLALDWQRDAVEPRAWKSVIPLVWSNLMTSYWERYRGVYARVQNRGKAPEPQGIEPGWAAERKRELLDISKQAGGEAAEGALLTTLVLGGLVVGGLYFLLRPRRRYA